MLRAAVSLERGTISKFLPEEIDGWLGTDVPLGGSIIRNTDTDDHVSRAYTRAGSREGVMLFIGYGVRLRDLMPHRPEVCYPGAGWTLGQTRVTDLELDSGRLPCRVLTFSRGGLGSQRATVLNYYLLDGKYCPDVSLLRSKAWRPDAGVRYVAQIQITATDDALANSAASLVESFARDSASAVRDALQEAVASREQEKRN